MARKSIQDLYNQYLRIVDENAKRGLTNKTEQIRAAKAQNIYLRYAGNISAMKSMQKNPDTTKKFSRNTYMGLAEG